MTEILSKSIERLFKAKTAEEYSGILTNYAIGVCMDSDIRNECFAVNRKKEISKNKIIKILEWVSCGKTGSS
ncbi:MAG: hypothetical protein M0R48_10945, partial [Candidatus Omnitrophica bacterium]|nr:hypothetical protein [Candidatus Omnitrophota bacterium]